MIDREGEILDQILELFLSRAVFYWAIEITIRHD